VDRKYNVRIETAQGIRIECRVFASTHTAKDGGTSRWVVDIVTSMTPEVAKIS
jgi:hypothetical protein